MRQRQRLPKETWKLPTWTTTAVTICWWLLLLVLILFVDPARLQNVAIAGLYLPFLLLLFLAVSWTLYLLRKKWWPSLLLALAVSGFLTLRLYGWGNIINFLTFILIMLILERYWHKQNRLTFPQPESEIEIPKIRMNSD